MTRLVTAGLLLSVATFATAQAEEEEQPYFPGLVAKYAGEAEQACARLDESIAFDWGADAPDPRIPAGKFRAHWKGRLLSQAAGEYRLHAYVQGKFAIRLAGKEVLAGTAAEPRWFASPPLELAYDHHPLEVTFKKTAGKARIALFWSGPQFQLEPISPRQLFHDRGQTPDASFERGQLLAAALRCTSCHAVAALSPPPSAPALDKLAGNIAPEWLVSWIENPHASQREISRMPGFGLSREDASAIAAFLMNASQANEKPQPKKQESTPSKPKTASKPTGKKAKGKQNETPKIEPPSAKQGEHLFLTLGCLACHQLGELGESGLFGGGELTRVAEKRPAEYFGKWLAEPASLNQQHRMPVFDLNANQLESLTLFLQEQHGEVKRAANTQASGSPELAVRGAELVKSHNCAACHQLPGDSKAIASKKSAPLNASSNWVTSCTAEANRAKQQPGYRLKPEDAAALKAYFSAINAKNHDRALDGRQLLVEQNCLACHPREGLSSLAHALPARLQDKLATVAEQHEQLAALVPAMTPPALNSVGDKLHDQVLAASIRRQGAAHRPYLLVQMPKFRLSDEETAALVRYFVSTDRIPPLPAVTASPPTSTQAAAHALAGGRLVSADGFSCTSCHQVGSVVPDKAPLNARGPSLSKADARMRKEWFDRFVRNPARIVPRMEMPSVQLPVRGVLSEKLDDQLTAVWHVLNTPGFEPPEPNPVRVLRLSGVPERDEKPIVINDVFKLGDKTWINPLVIGLPNRHNVLIDLETNRLAGWWLGDTARQRTKGKSWHWEPGAGSIYSPSFSESEVSLIVNGKEYFPITKEQFPANLAMYLSGRQNASEYTTSNPAMFLLDYYFEIPSPDNAPPIVSARIINMFRPLLGDKDYWSKGFVRHITVDAIPPRAELRFRIASANSLKPTEYDAKARTLRLAGEGNSKVRLTLNEKFVWVGDGTVSYRAADGVDRPRESFRLEYSTDLPTDQQLADPAPTVAVEPVNIEIGNGFLAKRLPLIDDIMPTSMDWKQNGELMFTSLRGQVYRATDTDEDDLEDKAIVICDGLPTPYGIAARDRSNLEFDVLTKFAMIRVEWGNASVKDPFIITGASGWGHTDDYHDWAVGLMQAEDGEYYIGLPCQQDDRSDAAAKHRGQILKLVPRRVTKDNPRLYSIETVSSGHRFPMGMAMNRAGDLFVTDNQGNYNPFNELNHVRPGAHFGFINKLEKDKGYKPPRHDDPAINIPHPWTRSVNGICFLDTPEALRKQKGEVFGPLEGHLVGCEYDTRRLIRMTLEKIGGEYQGAAYSLSVEPSSPEKGLLGPIVCAVSPRGELYVGNIRDSGWGAGNNIGEIVQIKIDPAKLPCGIAEVRAAPGGFTIDFLQEVDAKLAAHIASYSVESYRRESTPAYGGPDLDRRTEKVNRVEVSPDARRVTLHLAEQRAGFVYDLRLKNLAPGGGTFHPAEAYYTLRKKL